MAIFRRELLNGIVECKGFEKKIALSLGTDTCLKIWHYVSYYGMRIGKHTQALRW